VVLLLLLVVVVVVLVLHTCVRPCLRLCFMPAALLLLLLPLYCLLQPAHLCWAGECGGLHHV
jgi:hypothetical protein